MKGLAYRFIPGLVAVLSLGTAHGQTAPVKMVPTVATPSSAVNATNAAASPSAPVTNAPPAVIPPLDLGTLLPAAQRGDSAAEGKLAEAYAHGAGVPEDEQKAYAWAAEAAFQGDLRGESDLAWLYWTGKGVHHNEVKAFHWYLRAAEQGDAVAERSIGYRYHYGVGAPKSEGLAVPWLRKAAIQGETQAQALYGYDLMSGDGTPKDEKQGFTYLLCAAANFESARPLIAKCYANGISVPPDIVKAYGWCLLSNQKDLQVTTLTESLKKKLTDAQMKEAQAGNKDWQNCYKGQIQTDALTSSFASGTSVCLPFKKAMAHFYLPVKVNNQEANFMVDTGCDSSVIDARLAAKLKLTGTVSVPITGVGPGMVLDTIADKVSLDLGGLSFQGVRIAILPGLDADRYLGKPVLGIIGGDLLRRFVVQIDYVHKTLTLSDPKSFAPDAKAACLPIKFRNNVPFIEAGVANNKVASVTGSFEIDTGDGGEANITQLFLQNHPDLQLKGVVSNGGLGVGGMSYTTLGKCSEMSFGGLALQNPLIDIFLAREGMFAGINGGSVGNALLSHFDVTFDYPGAKLYLKANSRFAEPFDFLYEGLAVRADGDNYDQFVVFDVLPQSPASVAGFRTGDVIRQVDKAPVTGMSLDDVYTALQKEGARQLLVQRDTASLTLTMQVFDPFKHPEKIEELSGAKTAPPAKAAPIIQDITVSYAGPAFYTKDVIVRASGLKIGDACLPFQLNRAVKTLYGTGFIKSAGVTATPAAGGYAVNLAVEAAPVVTSVAFTGFSPAQESKWRPLLRAEEGKRITAYEVRQDEQLLQTELAKAGGAVATVTSQLNADTAKGEAEVTYALK